LEATFECESNGITFVTYNSYFFDQIYSQHFFGLRVSPINRHGGSIICTYMSNFFYKYI
jgi:hypothetical protein